jgi:pimeloyl-ACP methyl ester carboxylesterase
MKTRIIQDDPGDGERPDGAAPPAEGDARAAASGEPAEDSGQVLAKDHGRRLRNDRHVLRARPQTRPRTDLPNTPHWAVGSSRGRRLFACLAALATLFTSAPAAAAPAATGGVATPHVPRLAWRDCGDGFDCTTARVPLDYDEPTGRTIELALIRLPATDPARRIGSLFVNPGGPGNSGVDFVRTVARLTYPAKVRARFDIIGMDPRGVAASTSVRCFASDAERQQFFADYNVLPVDRAELVAAVGKVTDLAQRCQARVGWLLPHLSTANVARDLDLLRKAVGDAKLSYVGYSYGTYLGATYANLFPDKVRVLALDGNTDPPAYPTGPRLSVPFIRVNAHLAASETLDQFFTLCEEAGQRCAFADGGAPRTKFATLAQRLRANPLTLPDGLRVGYAELVDFTLQVLYRAADWADGAATLQQLYAATSPMTRIPNAPAMTPSEDPLYSNVQEAFFASVCGETRNPADPFAYANVAARADRDAPHVGAFWTYLSLPCAVWPAQDADRYTGPWRVRTAHPALVLNNRYDPATGHRNALRMVELLTGSRLVTVEGWGHTARDTHSACADRILSDYLVDRTLPPRGTTCQPGIVPFGSG